ncbi:hypothetical protein IV203_012555 [Nitzschia inconspicua]|uniref:Uncharacterized protein n=1 Tax=Nitzschia inconspicua TaxID=303405 RepID=A0A9K3KU28_9STRA|nr:hypothetical protein IV203_012555 [Nitzschia inconspicua]
MGGGTSRLDETDWEIADGQITSVDQTIDGDAPTSKYQLYEIRKQSVGQRAFDVVDAQHNVLLTTQGVSGTLSWFDVLGPKSIGEYKDLKLRVQSDMSRRTWIVYRYHTPVFQGQKAANDVDNSDSSSSSSTANADVLFKGIEPGVKLYKTACITVSWSRYVAVAARYGPPSADDFLNLDIHDMIDPEDGNDTAIATATTLRQSNNGPAVSSSHDDNVSSSTHSVTDDDPLFSVAKQIAARSRERTTTASTTSTSIRSNDDLDDDETNNRDVTNDDHDSDSDEKTIQNDMETTLQDSKPDESKLSLTNSNNRDSVTALNIDTASSIDALSPTSSVQTSRSVTTSSTVSPPKRTIGPKRPATTLTELAASHSSSTAFGRSTVVGTQTIRDYFTKSTTSDGNNNTGPTSSRFGSRLFKRNGSSSSNVGNNATAKENGNEDPSTHASDTESRTTNSNNNNEPTTPRQLYELALEGVIDLDTQPIVQCQEISCKLLGNHQTFNMTKEQLFQLLRLDEKQHDEETHQQQQQQQQDQQEQNERAPQGETDEEQQKQEDSANPMVQAMKLDVAQQQEADGARSSRWISSIRNFRARGGVTKTESEDNAAATTTDETLKSKENGDDINQSASSASLNGSSPNQGRLRSSFHRLFSSTSAEEVTESSPNDDMVLSVETLSIEPATKTHETSVTDGETPFNAVVGDDLDRNNLPSLLDESVSSSQQLSDNGNCDVVDHSPLTETAETKTPESSQSPSPGSGVEESKVEAPETPQNVATNSAAATKEGVSPEEIESPGSTETNAATTPVDNHPHPLVGYWFWKHTTFHFGQHKMFLHLAKNSDLALHLILSIIVNQVRSERNHTIFATTGLHPALFFIDPRNPKAMIT